MTVVASPVSVRGMSITVADERARLHERLAELDRERDQITFALSVLDRIAAAEPSVPVHPRKVPNRGDGAQPRRQQMRAGGSFEHAVRIITESDRAWRADDLAPAMRANGWAAEVEDELQTVRTVLARAARTGQVRRVGPGLYAAPDHDMTDAGATDADADGVDEMDSRGNDDERPVQDAPSPAALSFAGPS